MPTPSLTDEQCLEALKALAENGGNRSHAAKSLKMDRSTFVHRLRTAENRGLHFSEGARDALDMTGLGASEARMGWRRVQNEDGSFDSVMWKAPETEQQDYLETLRDVFDGVSAAPVIQAPESTLDDYCTVYPLMDAHFGMHAWGRETGGDDYDIKHAKADMHHAFAKLAILTPNSRKSILLVGGDFFHADDHRAETPQSKHKLDVDGRHWKVLDEGVRLLASVIEGLAQRHSEVLVRVLRGNHDEHAHLVLTFALSERYRDNVRIEIEKDPRDIFMHQWGTSLIAAHHGDKAKPDRLTLYLSDVCDFWSATRHRHLFTGHIHHDNAKDIGPLRWESLRAFCPPDSYAASMGYGARRAMQSVTFHKHDGIVQRNLDPIERQK